MTLVVGLAPVARADRARSPAWRGPGDTLTEMGWFFSRASLVTFGGAYAVLAYVNVAAVSTYGWLLPGQMVVGLGLAETHARAADHGVGVRGVRGRVSEPG